MEQIKKTVIDEYWLKKLSGELPVISLPSIHDIIKETTAKSQALSFQLNIPEELIVKLKKIAKNSDIGLFILFLSALNIVLNKYTGIEDLIVGIMPPVAGGNDGKDRNILFCRNRISSPLTVKELIDQTKQEVIEAVNYSEFSLDCILAELQEINNNRSINIFKIALTYDSLQVENRYLDRFDLVFVLSESNTQMVITVKYPSSPHAGETAERFSRNVLHLLDGMVENPGQKVYLLDVLTVEEKQQLLYEFNDTAAEYPRDKTIHQLFEAQAERSPDHIAVVGAEGDAKKRRREEEKTYLSYRELNESSGKLAGLLREKGVKPNIIVGIMVVRSLEMIIGIFGILKSGGAYLPINPQYPEARINYMLKDSAAKIMIRRAEDWKSGIAKEKKDVEIIFIDSLEPSNFHPSTLPCCHASNSSNIAYVIYTSGSTGNPKGVMIEHHSVVNRLHWMQKYYPINPGDVILQKTPAVFDVSVWELFWWSFQGASLCLLGVDEEKSPEAIIKTIARNKISTIHFVPSMLQVFLEYCEYSVNLTGLSNLRQVFSSGEALGGRQVAMFRQLLTAKFGVNLVNLYGPTEATVDVSFFNCLAGENINEIPIGRPIDNINLHIVDQNQRFQPIGVKGELCISGVGLARGYLNRPELTAEKFIDLHHSSFITHHSKFYRTGDLARWLPDGNIEFLGRIDHQVKIRGFRIELGEIETQLLKHEDIKGAVVLFKESAGAVPSLFAYIATEKEFNIPQLREYLAGVLPDYMIPAHFMQVEKIPLTLNGKVDRKALELLAKRIDPSATYVAPQNEIEKKIAGIWQEVLNRDKVGIHDNYFEVGGTSFDIIRINGKLREVFQLEIPIVSMFRYTTVHSLAEYLNPNAKKEVSMADHRDRSAALERGKMDRRQRLQKRLEAGKG
ncbi:MAG: hypothetical protein QG657_974 [Acidobacteriota bacterium]|nr:hypothetical protein [Acidobacteriota bacterium]